MSAPPVDAVVLAAGASSRLGRPKQLVLLWERPLIARAVAAARGGGARRVHVVLGANAVACRGALRGSGARLHEFADWPDGQAASLAFGLAAVDDAAAAVLVMSCDQYRLGAVQIAGLIRAFRSSPARPCAARYGGVIGVPVIWPPEMAGKLAGAKTTGREWLARCAPRECALPEAAFDVDTPEDVARLRAFEAAHDARA